MLAFGSGRSKDQSQPLSVCLMEPENPHTLMKLLGDAGVQRFVLHVGKALTPALRQNDFLFATVRFLSS